MGFIGIIGFDGRKMRLRKTKTVNKMKSCLVPRTRQLGLKLVFQTADWDDINAVGTAVGDIANAYEHHHE